MQICVVTHNQAEQWERTGNRPNCKHHQHLPFGKALQMVLNDEALQLTGKRAIIIYPCILEYTWQSRSSGGFQQLELAPLIPSPVHPSRLEAGQ